MTNSSILETAYPLSFRKKDAKSLGQQIKNRRSVVLIGMKRVGISNFLRFFLYHKEIVKTYIDDGKNHLFIPIDLNDLVEREIYPFWVLTQKRILDAVEKINISDKDKKHIEVLFLDSIQSQDLFLTIDSIRKSLVILSELNFVPTLFYLRFDRMKDSSTSDFFSNLQGLVDATHGRLSYVFTSVRSLDNLSPEVFSKPSVSVFAQNLYIKPTEKDDSKIIFSNGKNISKLNINPSLEKKILELVDGYVQYVHFSIAFLHEKNIPNNKDDIFEDLAIDERIALQSEELWESLEQNEQDLLIKFVRGEKLSKEEKKKGEYVYNTGLIGNNQIFSPLFAYYLRDKEKELRRENQKVELSKKENSLLNLLKEKRNEVCEREEIIEEVWPEVESLGVSDWAIDRLVARLRGKLKLQKSSFEIVTVKTRGYKLTEN